MKQKHEAEKKAREQKALELISELIKKQFRFKVDVIDSAITITLDNPEYTKEELEYLVRRGFSYEDCTFSYEFGNVFAHLA